MKKVLFASALLALVAGCAENELDSLPVAKQNNGISFVAEQATSTRMQWDETTASYVPFWYAENDRIGIFAANVMKGDAIKGNPVQIGNNRMVNSWQGLPTTATGADAIYKATQSKQAGAFTAVDDNGWLHFNGNKKAHFLAVYPQTIQAMYKDGKIVLSGLPDIKEQTQTTVKGNNTAVPMYSMSIASKENSYDAVGEKVNLQFKRPLSAVVLKTKNVNKYTALDSENKSIFGKLTKVTVEAKGYTDKKAAANSIKASLLAYDNEKATIEVDTLKYAAEFKSGQVANGEYGGSNKVVLTIGESGLNWNDDALAVATIMDVTRKDIFSAEKPETVEITFTFEKIDLLNSLTTSNKWDGFVAVPALDIEKFPYLVTKASGSSGRTLIVNSGKFSDIYVKESGTTKIKWTEENAGSSAQTTAVGLEEIETIISNVELTNDELLGIKNFSTLKNLTLAENTAIPAGTFDTDQAKQLESLNLPKVTSVDKEFVEKVDGASDADKKLVGLITLVMPAYEFKDTDVNGILLNNNNGNTVLKTLDMSGVASMMPDFGVERTMRFANYTKLETVTVKDGVIVAPNGFAGCTALETIKGKLDISSASCAFKMGTATSVEATNKANTKLTSVEVCGTVIPDEAFTNCVVLATVKCNGSAVVPTSIGESAFENTAVEYMDLSRAATIGKAAFKNTLESANLLSDLSGKGYPKKLTSTSKTITTLTVGAEKLTESMFAGTGVKMVKFTDATEITGNNVFDQANNLTQVWFDEVFALADLAEGNANSYGNVFGSSSASVDFWVNPSQTGISGNNLTLSYKTGTGTDVVPNSQTYTFESIQKK